MPAPVISEGMRFTHATFAPALSDDLIAQARALFDAVPARTRERDVLDELHRCVAAWWEAPDSAGTRMTPKVLSPGGAAAPLTALDRYVELSLWDAIPWEHEIEAIKDVVAGIQAAENGRNSERLEGWRAQLVDALAAAEFAPAELEWVRSPARAMLRDVLAAMARHGDAADPAIDGVIGVICPGQTRESIRATADRMRDVQRWATAFKDGAPNPPVPCPPLEDTRLRDAAHLFLWYTAELTLGREPVHQGKFSKE